ncbi:MAG: DoxX family membrane protein [Candidatus Atribacteria bacterium]|nr:DoxX family membrane protein [Candidatus Atribacteria bacterium]
MSRTNYFTSAKKREFPHVYIIARLILGMIFIYAGVYKISNPQEFVQVVKYLNFFPHPFVNIITSLLPWIELILGILLVTGILAKYAALVSSLLLVIFIYITIVNTFRGVANYCGCSPESFILSSNNPFVMVTRDFVFLLLSIAIIISQKNLKSKPLISIKGHVYDFFIILLIAFSSSILMIFIAERKIEKIYILNALNETHSVTKNAKNVAGKQLPHFVLNGSSGSLFFPNQLKGKYSVLLILNSIECKACVDEAIFMDKLYNKFNANIHFYAIVGEIGNTAISNFKKSYSLSYPFLEDLDMGLRNNLNFSSNTTKILVSPVGEILNVDPPTYNIKSLQNDYERMLVKYLEDKRR